jgi:hypothetical protein
LPHAISKNTNIRNFFLLYKLLSVSFLTKKGKNLAWIMLLWNHYILWLLKKFTQYGDFFLTFLALKNKKCSHLVSHAVNCMRKYPPTQILNSILY